MHKLRFMLPLFLSIILTACNGEIAAPDPGPGLDATYTAVAGTARAEVFKALTPEVTPTVPPPTAFLTLVPTSAPTVTGPQYGPAPAVSPTPNFQLAKGALVPWQNSTACKATEASLQALATSAAWQGDLTNDGQVDYLVLSGQGLSVQSCRTGELKEVVQVSPSVSGQGLNLLGVADLNRNAVPEAVVAFAGAVKPWDDGQPHLSQGLSGSEIVILEWNGSGFSRYDLFVPVMSEALLTDVDGNGTVEIVATSEFRPQTDLDYVLYWDAYPWRKTTSTYAWAGQRYALMSTEKGPAEYSSELLAEARETRDYEKVLKIYGQLISAQGLKGWTPAMDAYKTAMAKYYQGGQQGVAPVAPPSSAEVVTADQAWAHYFVILRATAEGDLDLALYYNSLMQSQFSAVEPAKPVLGLAAAFVKEYFVSLDISQACYQARVFAVQQGWSEAASGCFYQEAQAPIVLNPPSPPAVRMANQAPEAVLSTQAEIGSLPSIWDVTQITDLDLSAPGTRSFDQALPQDQPLAWPFFWCTSNNPELLKRNLDNLTVFFLIDGARVPDEYLVQYHAENSLQQCNFWATALRNWKPGSKVQLEIVYFFRSAVYDGSKKYPAGEYRYRLTLHVP